MKRRGYATLKGLNNKPLLRYPFIFHKRDELIQACASEGITLGRWFESCIHPAACNIEKLGYRKGQCPNAEWLSAHIVNLPTHPGISLRRARYIIDRVAKRITGYM
ncbi:hypothetical protein DAMNIGENAA_33280 [Desulforhabdus amnigena]|uniref:DegT/DnrJ/EryC1/StrS aminotransferase n=2 Tax=Desulforhabdus amnigena TaxID=40218 RepID=A0A9W6LA95_9BACT|nr:hypothetical protein DAMNIGENAA_33280 [Desulforhabdus amnigena]